MNQHKELRTIDAARLLGVSTGTVRRYADQGILECDRLPSGERRVCLKSVMRLVNARNPDTSPQDGMALRDWFAGQAMQAMVSCLSYSRDDNDDDNERLNVRATRADPDDSTLEDIGRRAYNFADRMLAEREKEEAAS